ncbi:hypothetical protein PT277_03080 [Acetobacteraceae bacterium ESL0709]|nr:hypothetical protein [Acetobacteraceae bacterium ESL0697]MDF7677685.1 hypothetical protein [Acetobacteraceae bacterium ESL0709]
MNNVLWSGLLLVLAVILLGLVQFYLSFVGYWHVWGLASAIIALVVTFVFRTSILLLIGTYLGAVHVWHWPWLAAILISIPSIFFLFPGAFIIFVRKFGTRDGA